MTGLLLKDIYTLRQYGKTLLFMLVFFAVISAGMDNPAVFFQGFMIVMFTMIAITSFSYDALAKWDRYALSMPVTRKEVVASKYLLSLILCLSGTAFSFLISAVILRFSPAEGFGLKEHLLVTGGIVCVALIFFSILLPLIVKFGVEKSRIIFIAVFASPTAVAIVLDKTGIGLPSGDVLISIAKLLPFLAVLLYLFSFFLSVRLYSKKEI